MIKSFQEENSVITKKKSQNIKKINIFRGIDTICEVLNIFFCNPANMAKSLVVRRISSGKHRLYSVLLVWMS